MNLSTVEHIITSVNTFIWGWPLIIFFISVGLAATFMLNFVQFRYFTKSWKLILAPKEQSQQNNADMSPFQAFLNALSTSLGNGSLAGMSTAIFSGGPGAAFWIFILGIFALPIRFCEVYLSNAFEGAGNSIASGGPMLYLKKVPGKLILPGLYAFFCLLLGFISGNAIQANSISNGTQNIVRSITGEPVTHTAILCIALIILSFVVYVVAGGAYRIVKISAKIVPLKVGLFFASAIIVFLFNLPYLLPALKIIFVSAFTPDAIKGAILGKTMQEAIRFGMSRALNASEAGLGTAAVFFGSTGSKNPVENGILSMVSVFISNYLVCFMLCLLIVMSGVWNIPHLNGIDMTSAAFATAFGGIASWLVTLLSITFGIGVLVAYAYIGRECWHYLTGNRWTTAYNITYCALTFIGALVKVKLVFEAVDIVNGGLLLLNLFAISWLLPQIRAGVLAYQKK